MNKVKASYLNITASLFQQIVGVILGFISRMLFVHILGVEILGLNNTFESVLGTLALADLGIQRAITFCLYKPFQENDYKKVNSILMIYKWFYRLVAAIIFIGSVICIPFLPRIITGFEFKSIFIMYFMLQVVSSTCSYLLAYKRVLFYVNQRDYITKLIDAGSSFIFLLLKIYILYTTESYMGYLMIQITQTILSNVVVHLICSKKYPYISAVAVDKKLFKYIWGNIKDVIFGRLASFVYDSTDNLVISVFVSTTMVGLIGNYVLVTSSIKKILNSLINPMGPIIGNLVVKGNSKEKKKVYEICDQYCFWISMILLVPTFGLIDNFISIWIGSEYLMSKEVGFLLVCDLFIFIRHGIPASFIMGQGLFNYEKKVDIVTAILNIVTSIFLVQFAGIIGVLVGTIVSECFMLIGRKYLLFKYCLEGGQKEFAKELALDGGRFILFGFMLVIAALLATFSITGTRIIDFLIQGCVLEVITVLIIIITWRKNAANRQLIRIVGKTINTGLQKILDIRKERDE